MYACSFFSLLCVCFFSTTSALYGHGLVRCQFSTAYDAVYLEEIYFNKIFLGDYNSSRGTFVGYTNFTIEIIDQLNKNPAFLAQEQKNTNKCTTHVALLLEAFARSVNQPYIRLRSAEGGGSHTHMLVCSVYNFYPEQIQVTWLRNGEAVTSDVTSTDEVSSGNWLYQIHSHLEYTPRPGETITCKVEHASFTEPQLHDWKPISASEREKIAVGSAGVVLGFVFLSVGIIYYYMKNKTGHQLVPNR